MKTHSAQTRKTLARTTPFGIVFLLIFALFCSSASAKRSHWDIGYGIYTHLPLSARYNWSGKPSDIWSDMGIQLQNLEFVNELRAPAPGDSKPQDMNVGLKNLPHLPTAPNWHSLNYMEIVLDDHQPSVSDAGTPRGLSTYLSHAVNDRVSFSPYFHHERSSGGSDIGLGVQMSLKL